MFGVVGPDCLSKVQFNSLTTLAGFDERRHLAGEIVVSSMVADEKGGFVQDQPFDGGVSCCFQRAETAERVAEQHRIALNCVDDGTDVGHLSIEAVLVGVATVAVTAAIGGDDGPVGDELRPKVVPETTTGAPPWTRTIGGPLPACL